MLYCSKKYCNIGFFEVTAGHGQTMIINTNKLVVFINLLHKISDTIMLDIACNSYICICKNERIFKGFFNSKIYSPVLIQLTSL